MVEKDGGVSVVVGRNDRLRIGDVGSNKSSSLQGLIRHSREGQELCLLFIKTSSKDRHLRGSIHPPQRSGARNDLIW